MKKERLFHLINVCIGVGVLVYGIYGVYSGAYLLVDFLGETGELIKSFYSMTLWYTMLVDYLAYIILGIFRAYPFIRRKTGKYLVNVGCANLLCVLITDVFYHKELGFSMSQMNHRRIILPIIFILAAIWWQYYYKNNEERIHPFFPFVGEFVELIRK